MLKNIDISVVMPVYNAEKFVLSAIESVFAQDNVNFELIVINDGSTDRTEDIMNSIVDARLKYYRKDNGGIVSALNFAIPKAIAPIIARMDADDLMVLGRLRKQLNYMNENELDVVGGSILLIDENNNIIGKKQFPITSSDIISSLPFLNPFCHPATLIKKDALQSLGGYKHKMDGAEDFDLWCRISKSFQIGNMSDVVLLYRLTSNSISQSSYLHRISLCRSSISENIPDAPIVFYSFKKYIKNAGSVLRYALKYAGVTQLKSFYYVLSGIMRALNFSRKVSKDQK